MQGGCVPISWQEIESWNRVASVGCSGWELIALRKMSEAFSSTTNSSNGKDFIAPYESERNNEVEDIAPQSFLNKYIKNG